MSLVRFLLAFMRHERMTLIYFCLVSSALGQVPQGLTVSQDVRLAPQLSFLVYWEPVNGATAYRVYDAPNSRLTDDTCPATLPFDSEVTAPFYSDNPVPSWYLLPITDGRWKQRAWCYAVSSVVNGIESAKTPAKSIVMGNAGYVFFSFRGPGTFSKTDKCAGGPSLPLQSTNLADYQTQLYYTDPSGVKHYFNTFNLFERNVLGIIWHAPAIATDGTVIPWSNSGSYGYVINYLPLRKSVEGFWNPRGTIVNNYYIQVGVEMLIDPGQTDNGAQCPDSYFETDALWESVTQ